MLAPRPAAPGAPVSGSLGIALGLPAGAAAALVAGVLPHGAAVAPALRLGALVAEGSGGAAGSGSLVGIALTALVAGALGAITGPWAALAAAAQVWACWDGFVRHGLGVLVFGPDDLAVLGVVTAAALATAGVAALHRRHGVGVRGYAAGHLPAFLDSPVAD